VLQFSLRLLLLSSFDAFEKACGQLPGGPFFVTGRGAKAQIAFRGGVPAEVYREVPPS
jgi:hypothetical protein